MAEMSTQQAVDLARRSYESGQSVQAEGICRQILGQHPDHPDALNLLGIVVFNQGKAADAIELMDRAVKIAPDQAHFHCNRALMLVVLGRLPEALAAALRAVELRPNMAAAHNYVGHILYTDGQFTAAIEAYQRALSLNPDFAPALNNLGNALKDSGRVEESIEYYERAVKCDPRSATMQSNLVLASLYHPTRDRLGARKILMRWNEQIGKPLAREIQRHGNDRDLNRRLRIGYVSADFREHSVAFFMENLLANHSAEVVEIFCYCDLVKPDEVSGRLQKLAHHWRPTVGISDARIAEMVREDQIDILVDLAGHTAGNRLLVFARKPAPVQVTYLGYPGSTGLSTMDYRLTDRHLDALGESSQSESLIRLPNSFACYKPPEQAERIGGRAARAGNITFAGFNVLAKLSNQTLEAWAEILKQVPQSRLLMMARGLTDAAIAKRIREKLGVGAERLTLLGQQPMEKYLSLHQDVDVVLDTFPVNGHTTTCHALWMGVPVVCLAGNASGERLGASVLRTLGFEEWIAANKDDYIRIAVRLASDRSQLASLGASLREKMLGSPLMDGQGFAREVESAYRGIWRKWCESGT
jgi:protein O-GlcNAc transferase